MSGLWILLGVGSAVTLLMLIAGCARGAGKERPKPPRADR